MTAILIAVVSKLWPAILGVLGIAGAFVFGWWKTKSANTTKAEAAATVAQAKQEVAQTQTAEAQANASAAKAGADAAAARNDINTQVSTQPTDEVRNELDQWTKG